MNIFALWGLEEGEPGVGNVYRGRTQEPASISIGNQRTRGSRGNYGR